MWEVPFEEISELQWLGSGAQGAVFLGKFRSEEVAIKKVREQKETDIKPLRKLKHPNIISFKLVLNNLTLFVTWCMADRRWVCRMVCKCVFYPTQGRVHSGTVLLHHHGVLCPGPAVRGAEGRKESDPQAAGGLGLRHRQRHELPPPAQDHPQRSQVAQVSFCFFLVRPEYNRRSSIPFNSHSCVL